MQIRTLIARWIPAALPTRRWMLILHGRGDSMDGFAWLPEALGRRDIHYLFLNAPDRYYTGYSWYELPPEQRPGVERSSRLLDRVMDEAKAQGFTPEDCLAFGFSQGCLMNLEWGLRTSHRLAGLIGISGYCLDPKKLIRELSPHAKSLPFLITHGTDDEVLPFSVTESQVRTLKKEGLPLEFHSYKKGHSIDEADEWPMIQDWITRFWPIS